MEKFLNPLKVDVFIIKMLELATENAWAIVVESDESFTTYVHKNAAIVPAPAGAMHNYHSDCILTAFEDPVVSEVFVHQLMNATHSLSVFCDGEMLLLCADDYHEACISCSPAFYDKYYRLLLTGGYIISP